MTRLNAALQVRWHRGPLICTLPCLPCPAAAVVGCGLAPTYWVLIACRMLVGVGEASFVALAAPFIGAAAAGGGGGRTLPAREPSLLRPAACTRSHVTLTATLLLQGTSLLPAPADLLQMTTHRPRPRRAGLPRSTFASLLALRQVRCQHWGSAGLWRLPALCHLETPPFNESVLASSVPPKPSNQATYMAAWWGLPGAGGPPSCRRAASCCPLSRLRLPARRCTSAAAGSTGQVRGGAQLAALGPECL